MELSIIVIQNGALEANCYYIYKAGASEGVVIDPGDEPEELIRRIEATGVKPCLMLATHGHIDHVGAARRLKEHFGIPLAAFVADEQVMQGSALYGALFGLGVSSAPSIDQALADGQVVKAAGLELKVLHTPGHSPGSACFWCEASGDLFSGDTLFANSVGRPDLPGGDAAVLEASLKGKVYALPEDTRVWPGHGESTTVGREKWHNPFIRCAR